MDGSDHVAAHDDFVLRELGGGGIHSCGRIEHHVSEFLNLPSLRCIDFGQPHLNNLDAIYAKARVRKIPLIRFCAEERDLLSGSLVMRFPTGVTLVHEAKSLIDAQRIWDAYRTATEG